jgi:hypothetical protein
MAAARVQTGLTCLAVHGHGTTGADELVLAEAGAPRRRLSSYVRDPKACFTQRSSAHARMGLGRSRGRKIGFLLRCPGALRYLRAGDALPRQPAAPMPAPGHAGSGRAS